MTNHKKKNPINQHLKQKPLNIFLIVIAIVFAVLILLFVYPGLKNKENNLGYYNFTKEGELTISDSLNSVKVKIDIEIANTEYERQLGLMKRLSMADNQGMLFIFPVENFQSFWMRNTLFSLDMIFINANRQIVTIHKRTKVLSDDSYPSTAPAQYVLEVNAGFTDKYNVNIGDKIEWTVK